MARTEVEVYKNTNGRPKSKEEDSKNDKGESFSNNVYCESFLSEPNKYITNCNITNLEISNDGNERKFFAKLLIPEQPNT
jgi:hypothetical protein